MNIIPSNSELLNVENDPYLNNAVAEYIYARESVANAFLLGIIKMGEILHKHREELKKSGKWLDFCSRIGVHFTQANQQIRMYELSLDNTRIEIIKKTITNWTKLNMFMSLDDELREEVVDLIEQGEVGEDISANDFRDLVTELKGVDIEKEVKPLRNPIHEDSKFAADTIREVAGLSHSSTPFLEAYSSIQKGIEILQMEIEYPETEKEELHKLLQSQIKDLSDVVWTLGYNSNK